VVRVGFKDPWDDIFVSCPGKGVFKSSGELYSISRSGKYSKTVAVGEIEAAPGALYRLRCVSTQGKAPYVNIYTAKGVLAGRSVDRLTFGPRQAGVPVMVYDLKPNGTYSFNAYRGSMEFSPSVPGKLLPGNVLTLEEYLAGVVPSEMPASYPEEALKAMAVVARTFASSLVQDGKHKKEGFDVCNYVHCQVYGGILKERHSASRAIAATRGMVARYRGKFPNTTFHATNGGFGARAVSVWSFDTPYLQGGFDGPGEFTKDLSREENLKEFIDNPPPCYDSKAGRFRWKESFAVKDLEKLLAESLGKGGQVETGTLQSIRVTSRSADGRAQELEVVMSGGVFRPKKDSMRWITSGGKIGTGGLQSTLFYVTREGDRITFHGGGWGHGVGLSQEGARGRAEAGHKYDEIIKAYYQGVEITGDY
jgi:SpoIID/LytB domain protein